MLDLFTIFSKGGIVLWYFQSTSQIFTPSVNALIRSVVLQERTGSNSFDHNTVTLKYKLDNEFELLFVVAYQKILQLSYVDKFLNDIHLEFRDKYKNDLQQRKYFQDFDFSDTYRAVLAAAEQWGKQQAKLPKQMRTFEESQKSKKTVASMIERKGEEKENKKAGKAKKKGAGMVNGEGPNNITAPAPVPPPAPVIPVSPSSKSNDFLNEEILAQNRMRLAQKMARSPKATKQKSPKPEKEKAGKKPRVWELGGTSRDVANLERTRDKPEDRDAVAPRPDTSMVGTMSGGIRDLEVESSDSEAEYDEDDGIGDIQTTRQTNASSSGTSKAQRVFSMFRGLVGSKSLTQEDMAPVLDKLKDHLIAKNVAADIAGKLCDSVATSLEGKVVGTFDTVAKTVRAALTDALLRILSPKRRVDVLRDALEARRQGRPFVITFCGVNGVGKSTNLAKICFWLVENGLRVLIAACDTFRAGAVEQLRTHTRSLNNLHPPEMHGGKQMVQLYEKGYGKDAAGIAMEAIGYARDQGLDVVLVDTAGRMQDNEPLMRALAKLIKVNQPDLVLFVGEALVGNEAVDQLVKFNQALADYSSMDNPHLVDGIVLTKFDTIDDKVGAAISMTYITGQPIVFVGTGQTYTDLKSLNAKVVVSALMK
ncbi:signal recognition particle receptor subunit alpha homolog isoform X1 [Schistocerca piceifrons]|uniref:signal recognition particle receptor subunit alpha homolog isoform X1 n=1 Tax=Schistocerca piceifrons TaxID=274613 RepID=UPI001F5F2793|nr:signal recognition particle receptor subunit alpha homolog isoform X1 [Schistocerca piceifrons]